MASPRSILNRRRAVRNIRAVTRTMEMASVAQYQRVRQLDDGVRPALEQVERMLTELAPRLATMDHPFLRGGQGTTCAVVIPTSDRGLCGDYNNTIMEVARLVAEDLLSKQRRVEPYVLGHRGLARIRRDLADDPETPIGEPYKTHDEFRESELRERVAEIAGELMARVGTGELAAAYIVYARMVGAVATGQVATLLPLAPQTDEPLPGDQTECDFIPSAEAVIEELLPLAVRLRLLACFLDSHAAEHASRMTAMRAATGNADDMIAELTRQVGRARRDRITAELAEIFSGAEALT